ncbi:MAG: hypothetical protein EXS09_12300 [Gemmataceae bacterium]|nr:hypothetical protein [Gemmataceae bacterium]
MNTAILLFSACLAGADPVPPPPAAPAPAVVKAVNNNLADCCGKASVCGDSCPKVSCGLIQKIKDKISCWKKCVEKSNDCSHKSLCDKPAPAPVAAVAPAPVAKTAAVNKDCFKGDLCKKIDDCGKNACGRAQVSNCDDCFDKLCWKPGYFLHKCKEKLCSASDKKDNCFHGGCGTAAMPNSCGTSVIAPAAPVAPKKIPEKVG